MNHRDCDLTDVTHNDRGNLTEQVVAGTNGDAERELDYQPVPATSVRRVRAKFRDVGRGQPMPFRIENEI